MKIAITHENADFDALASVFAVVALDRETVPILGRRVITPVRNFLALHKDHFATRRYSDLSDDEIEAVEEVTIVDVRRGDRLPPIERITEAIVEGSFPGVVEVYDHHPASAEDVPADREWIEPIGANVTQLVERIAERRVAIDAAEATLFALGIYSDTGSLRYAGTTGRDARAVGWLLEHGAQLQVVGRYLRATLSDDQREAIAAALDALEILEIGGAEVGLVCRELGKVVPGLSQVARHVLELQGLAALFAVFGQGRKGTQVVARSRVPYLDVGAVLETLGGGGHAGAAAARVRDKAPKEVADEVVAALRALGPTPRVVGDVMSSPVRTVEPERPLSEVAELLEQRGHSGMPVVRDGVLIGIISQRDVAGAEKGGRVHLPVSSCMSHEVHRCSPRTALDAALRLMESQDIGRLPVLDDQRLVGIVTRTDVLRALYASNADVHVSDDE